MIINYKVKNFYSIGKDGACVSFAVDGNAPKTNLYIDKGEVAGRVSLLEAVIGPNASGKTKLLQGLAFVNYLITSSYVSSRPTAQIPFNPNAGLRDSPSEISVRFVTENRVFEYAFKITKDRILAEDIKEISKTVERTTAKTIFSRSWNEATNEYDLTDKEFGITDQADLRKNASIISSAMQKDAPSPLAKLIFDYWNKCVVVHNLWAGGNIEDADTGGQRLNNSLEEILDPENADLRKKVEQILEKYDIGFDEFHDQVIDLPDEKVHIYNMKHKFSERSFMLQMREESSGTKRLIMILTDIVNALLVKEDGLAVIDEIDAFLHPDIVEALIDLFIQPETNPYKAQLLFSTHNHRILESLDKQQIILTEKNEIGETESWRLDEMSGVKSTDNYYTKYITGAYGARPKIES